MKNSKDPIFKKDNKWYFRSDEEVFGPFDHLEQAMQIQDDCEDAILISTKNTITSYKIATGSRPHEIEKEIQELIAKGYKPIECMKL